MMKRTLKTALENSVKKKKCINRESKSRRTKFSGKVIVVTWT